MESASSENLCLLEKRIEDLEKLIYSNDPRTRNDLKILQELAKYSKKVKDAERSHSHVKRVFNQLDNLEKFASMCHADTLEKPTDFKIDYIEASDKQLREQAKHLENVEKLKWVLDSEHLKSRVTSDLNVKLLQVSRKQESQREEATDGLEKTKQLVENYNKAISAVTRQFEQWNAVVTKLEEEQLAQDTSG